jgi:acyl carrier protein
VAVSEKEIREQVKNFIVTNFFLDLNTIELNDDSSFLDNGYVDSTGMLEVIGFLEETYGISIADDEMVPENLDSLSNIGAYVTRKTQDN